eukprot:TRINITY_DN7227_c0_g1_i1.p1 TRINITY_DN7227_c0_g1~~TRINITY_DN7227_c0_g1_i1.p1  ORF type:complete len:599 (+),score=24.34 TRINITY_DN7227_c0_g1_i1:468-2264(+)
MTGPSVPEQCCRHHETEIVSAGLVSELKEEEITKRLSVEREEYAARSDTELREEASKVGRFIVGMRVVARCLIRQGARTVQAGEVGNVHSPQDGVEGVPVKFGKSRKLVIVPEGSLISKREADARAVKSAAAELKAAANSAQVGGDDEPGAVEQELKKTGAGGTRPKRHPSVQDGQKETGAAGALCSTRIQCKEDDDAPQFQGWHTAARKGTRGAFSTESTGTEVQMMQTANNYLKKPAFRKRWCEVLLANGLSGEEQPEDFCFEGLRALLCEMFPDCDLDGVSVSSSHDSGIRASPSTSSAGHHSEVRRRAVSGATAEVLGGWHAAAGQRGVGPPASAAQRPVAAGQGINAALRTQHRGRDLGRSAGRGRGAPLLSPSQAVQQQDAGRPQRGARGGGRAQGTGCPAERGPAARGSRPSHSSTPEMRATAPSSAQRPTRSPGAFTLVERPAASPRRAPRARFGLAEPAPAPGVHSAAQEALTFAEAARGCRAATGACATPASGPSPAASGAACESQRDDDDITAPLLPVGAAAGLEDPEPDSDSVAHALNAGADYLRQFTMGALQYPPAAPAGGPAAPAGAPQTAAAAAAQHSGEAPQ